MTKQDKKEIGQLMLILLAFLYFQTKPLCHEAREAAWEETRKQIREWMK